MTRVKNMTLIMSPCPTVVTLIFKKKFVGDKINTYQLGFWNFCSHVMGVQIFQISMFEKSSEKFCEFRLFRLSSKCSFLKKIYFGHTFEKRVLWRGWLFWQKKKLAENLA